MAAPETRKSGRSASPSGKLLESIANDDTSSGTPPSRGEKQGPSKKLPASFSSAGSGVGSGTTPPPSPPLLPQASGDGEGKTEISMATLLAAITSLKEATELSQRTAQAAAQDAAEVKHALVELLSGRSQQQLSAQQGIYHHIDRPAWLVNVSYDPDS